MSKRMINPRIWESEQVTSLTMRQRLLWIGLITIADDQGRNKANAGLIRARVFPLDDFTVVEILADIQAIADAGLIQLYNDGERDLYQVLKWWDYQKPQWARPSDYSPPNGWTDRVRCRMGGEYVEINWKERETPNGSDENGETEPNDSPERSGERVPGPLRLSDRDSDSDSDSITHVAGATPAPPSGPQESKLDAVFGPKPSRKPVEPTEPWDKCASEPWAGWGSQSKEFLHQLGRFGGTGRRVQRLGYRLDTEFGLHPNWSNPKAVKAWAAGLSECLQLADHDGGLVIQAAQKLREGGMTIANPYSLHKTIQALAAERRAPPGQSGLDAPSPVPAV